MRIISPFRWLTLKTSLTRGLLKFKIFFLKVEYESEIQIFESNLFYSTNANGKKEPAGQLFLTLKWRTPSFDYCLFRMNCYLMELSQINILGNVL